MLVHVEMTARIAKLYKTVITPNVHVSRVPSPRMTSINSVYRIYTSSRIKFFSKGVNSSNPQKKKLQIIATIVTDSLKQT